MQEALCLLSPYWCVHFFAFTAYHILTWGWKIGGKKNDIKPTSLLRSWKEEGISILKRCLCSHVFNVTVRDHGRIPESREEKPQTWGGSEEERRCLLRVMRFLFPFSLRIMLKVNSHYTVLVKSLNFFPLIFHYILFCRTINKLWNNTWDHVVSKDEDLKSSHLLLWWQHCTNLPFSQPALRGSRLESFSKH